MRNTLFATLVLLLSSISASALSIVPVEVPQRDCATRINELKRYASWASLLREFKVDSPVRAKLVEQRDALADKILQQRNSRADDMNVRLLQLLYQKRGLDLHLATAADQAAERARVAGELARVRAVCDEGSAPQVSTTRDRSRDSRAHSRSHADSGKGGSSAAR